MLTYTNIQKWLMLGLITVLATAFWGGSNSGCATP
jgi:hypothetical protein